MKYIAVLACTVLTLICFPPELSHSAALNGDQLLKMLKNEAESGIEANVNRARAMGYVQGIQEAYLVMSTRDPNLKIYCLPAEGISNAQARDVVVRWLEAHPKRLSEPAMLLVFHALADAYSCGNP